MLSIAAVSDADYYLRVGGSGCGGSGGSSGAAADYYTGAPGEPPGRWHFVYRNDLGVSGEIHAGQPSGKAFATALNELRHPVSGEQLGRAPQHFATVEDKLAKWWRKNPEGAEEDAEAARIRFVKHKAHAVHGWDLTFSVVKSISVWHAALEAEGRHDEAQEVVTAMTLGIEAALRMAADEFGVTRRGAAGPDIDGTTAMRHVRVPDLQTAVFTHHTSRERDPQLHAHVMVLNRLLCEDNQWRALFASGLLKSKHQLDAVFTRVMEAELTARLGARWVMRPDGVARELVGVSAEVRDLFSARTRALSEEADRMVRDWAAEHGIDNAEDVPALIKWRLAQKANRKTRPDKPRTVDTPSRAQDVARWDAEIAAEFHEGFVGVLDEVDAAARTPVGCPDFSPDAVIAMALAEVTDRKGSFNRSHLWFAIDHQLPDMLGLDGDASVALVNELTDAAMADREVVSMAAPAPVAPPASLIDSKTGESVFEPPRGGRFTTRTHLSREDWLVGLLARRGAPVLSAATAGDKLSGKGLSGEQSATGVNVLTEDWFLALVEAGAGTGKSRLMAALSEASAQVWGHGLTGFTASQNAAEVLAREGVHRAYNISKYLAYRQRARDGEATEMDHLRFAVAAGATVVIDEASMVSTPQAVALIEELIEAGVGRVVMIGDTAQVDAVDAGGGFALLVAEANRRAERAGDLVAARGRQVHTLSRVRRFRHDWEREATAALRDGDLSALAAYDKRGRLRGGGEPEEVERAAVQALVEDQLLGLESVLVVSTGKQAAALSSQIRQRLVAAGRVPEQGLGLHDDTVAGVGDLVQTRMNDSALDVVNREVWRVEAVDAVAGWLRVSRSERDEHGHRVWGAQRTLPADYVAEHVELAYAATVQAVQGRTTDTGHLLVDDLMGRSRAYPGLTRGRERNTMWVPVERPARRYRESDAEYEARIPSALSKVVAAFEREDHTPAARAIIAAEQARATNLGRLGPEWQQLIAEHREVDHRQMLREIVGTDARALFADEAVEGVLHLMRSAESYGYDVRAVMTRAYGTTRLANARTPGGLLASLFKDQMRRSEPTREVAEVETYAERTPVGSQPEIRHAREVGVVMDARVAELGQAAEVEPPSWATALLGGVPADIVERGIWREKVAVVAGYRERHGITNEVDVLGRAPSKAEPERYWEFLRATRALGGDPERDDVAGASDVELASRVLAYRRERESMPRNVDDDLREANDNAAFLRGRIAQARSRGEDSSSWTGLLRDTEARVARLDTVDAGRAVAVAATAPAREQASAAVREIGRRVERDRVVAERRAAERAETDREAREAADRDSAVHAAVGARWREAWVPDAPVFGSQRWAELEDDAPAKRAGLFTAALQYWRMGAERDETEINERLETHEVDQAPEHHLPHRALERIRAGAQEREARAAEPSREPEVLAEVHRYTGRELEGEAPRFGTPEYAAADPEVKAKAEARYALAWHGGGDDVDERAHRAEVAEERAGAAAIAAQVKAARTGDTRTHREIAEARGERAPEPVEPAPAVQEPPEPARPDTSWVRRAAAAAEKPAPEKPEPQKSEPQKPEPDRGPVEAGDRGNDSAPGRDDLEEQVARAQAAVQRVRDETDAREQARGEQAASRDQAERAEPPTREPEAAER